MTAARPAGFGYQGRKLWDAIAADSVACNYRLRPDELATLENACRIADMIDTLTKDWKALGKPTTAEGSMGQLIIHPLVDKLADHRMKQSVLLQKLKIPDSSAADVAPVNAQRAGGHSRWAQAHGAGG